MRLNSLRLFNFRQHVDTRIEFDPGITGIIGPNGAGKSTLLEAIAWALYGMPAARGTRDSIRAYRAPARAQVKVELDFELGGHRYLVSRGLTSAEVYLDGSPAPVANSISGTTEFLRRRLGMTQQEFFNTYFTGQKELSIMAAMGPAERAQFLSRVLGYERLRSAQTLVRERKRTIVAEGNGVRGALPDPDAVTRAIELGESRAATAKAAALAATARRGTARTALDALAPRWEAMQRERDAVQALIADARVAEGERASSVRELERLEREIAGLAAARAELTVLTAELEPFTRLEAELRELERACNEDARRRTLAQTEASLRDEVARLRDRLQKIETAPALEAEAAAALEQSRAELMQAQRDFEAAQTDWIRDRQEAETKRQALLDQLREAEHNRDQIVELGESGTCPICARPLGTHFRTVLDLFEGQIETITVDGKYYRARIEQLQETPPEVATLDERRRAAFENVSRFERRLVKVQSAVQELATLTVDVASKGERLAVVSAELATIAVRYDAARHAEVKAAIARLAPRASRANALTAQLEREPQLAVERERATAALAQVDARLRDLSAKRAQSAFSEETFATMRERYESAAAELRAAELTAVAADAELAAATAALDAARHAGLELQRGLEQLAALDRERRLHDELDRAFGDLRTDLNQELRPEISDRASAYIRDLTDGRYTGIDLDEQYNVTLVEDAIPKPVISGGEEDLANLVLRLAISEMIAERAGQAFSLLILDEVFGSLDETRRHNVVDLLRRLQDRFEQVILITHIESVREGVDRAVTVRYDDETGISRVEADTAPGNALLEHMGAAD
ncbi:MAG TPA: SMC family ATPase [Gemmatimonadaceae bacterium]|nr:SMC family ATPase [Gemmatimonadaceae bacterium]